MNPDENVVVQRAALAVFLFISLVQLLSFYNGDADLTRCPMQTGEFGAKREAHFVEFSERPMNTKLEHCADLLKHAKLDARAATELQNGNLLDSPFEATLALACAILEDSAFLRANYVCAHELKHTSWDDKVHQIVTLLNSVFPVWFDCMDNDAEACNLVKPYLASLQKLSPT